MKSIPALVLTFAVGFSAFIQAADIPNPKIDYQAFLRDARKVGELRVHRRVTEDQFLRLAGDPGTIIYDARTRNKYELLHVKGARHLSLTDVTAEALAEVFPSKNTRILIYCNNNFLNEERAFASKAAPASLNIYTFNTLFSYGYTNVYELGPLTDVYNSKLPMAGSRAKDGKAVKTAAPAR